MCVCVCVCVSLAVREGEAASGDNYPGEMGRYEPAMKTLNVLHMELSF